MHRHLTAGMLLLAACAPDPEVNTVRNGTEPSVAPQTECLSVHVGAWLDAPPATADTAQLSLAWIVRLDSLPPIFVSEELPGARLAHTWVEGSWQDHPFQRWWMSGDSLFLDHPAAFSGTTLRLGADEDGFSGTATAHTDIAGEGNRVAVARLTSSTCPE